MSRDATRPCGTEHEDRFRTPCGEGSNFFPAIDVAAVGVALEERDVTDALEVIDAA